MISNNQLESKLKSCLNKDEQPLVLFDGVCNLCNSSVQFLLKADEKQKLKFASLQSFFPDENSFDSVLYFKHGELYTLSDAALEIARDLGGKWKWFYFLRFIPAWIRNPIYQWIAANRYSWFGKKEECMIPTPENKSRFITKKAP